MYIHIRMYIYIYFFFNVMPTRPFVRLEIGDLVSFGKSDEKPKPRFRLEMAGVCFGALVRGLGAWEHQVPCNDDVLLSRVRINLCHARAACAGMCSDMPPGSFCNLGPRACNKAAQPLSATVPSLCKQVRQRYDNRETVFGNLRTCSCKSCLRTQRHVRHSCPT